MPNAFWKDTVWQQVTSVSNGVFEAFCLAENDDCFAPSRSLSDVVSVRITPRA